MALTKEEENIDFWCQPETKVKILKRLDNYLITRKADVCDYIITHSKSKELGQLYRVFKRDPATVTLIISKLITDIEGRGEKIVNDETNLKDPNEFIAKLLDFKEEIDWMIKNIFL